MCFVKVTKCKLGMGKLTPIEECLINLNSITEIKYHKPSGGYFLIPSATDHINYYVISKEDAQVVFGKIGISL